jgi:hypothetical protein
LYGSSRRRPRDFATSAIFLSPTTESDFEMRNKKSMRASLKRRTEVTRSYLKQRHIVVRLTKHGESFAEHGEHNNSSGPNVDGGGLLDDLKQHLWSAEAFGTTAVHTITNLLVLLISQSHFLFRRFFFSEAEINQPERAAVGIEIVPAAAQLQHAAHRACCSSWEGGQEHEVVRLDVAVNDFEPEHV